MLGGLPTIAKPTDLNAVRQPHESTALKSSREKIKPSFPAIPSQVSSKPHSSKQLCKVTTNNKITTKNMNTKQQNILRSLLKKYKYKSVSDVVRQALGINFENFLQKAEPLYISSPASPPAMPMRTIRRP